jgi:hypothetical protein
MYIRAGHHTQLTPVMFTQINTNTNNEEQSSNQAISATQLLLILIKSSVQKNTQHSKQHTVSRWLGGGIFCHEKLSTNVWACESHDKRCMGESPFLLRCFFSLVSRAHGSSPRSMVHIPPSVYAPDCVKAMVFIIRREHNTCWDLPANRRCWERKNQKPIHFSVRSSPPPHFVGVLVRYPTLYASRVRFVGDVTCPSFPLQPQHTYTLTMITLFHSFISRPFRLSSPELLNHRHALLTRCSFLLVTRLLSTDTNLVG